MTTLPQDNVIERVQLSLTLSKVQGLLYSQNVDDTSESQRCKGVLIIEDSEHIRHAILF